MNRQKKSSLNQTYRQFLLTGLGQEDSKNLKEIVDAKLMGFGTAGDEKIMDFMQLKALLKQQKIQSRGMNLQWKIKPLSHYTSEDENTAIFADELLLKIDSGQAILKMYFRFSIVLNFINNQWKVIHWHGSKPEHVKSAKDTFGVERWRQKAEALEKVVLERTEDLVKKNRALEIESSLEKVRTETMTMKDSSALGNVIFNLYGELTKLDAKLDRCIIMIVNPNTLDITWWLSGKEGLLAENGFLVQNNDYPSHHLFLHNWKKRKKKWRYVLKGKEKKEWDKFSYYKTELVKLPAHVKKDMESVKKVYLSGSSDSFGCLITGSLMPLSIEHQEILSRFSSVFNQTYLRFLDVQKAEAQTKEAEIEAALERVRSRSMAMHKSDELKDVVRLVLDQFIQLKINVQHAGFYIDYKAQDDMHIWLADPNLEPFFATFSYFDTPTWNSFLEAKAKGTTFHSDLLGFEEKNKFYNQLFQVFDVPEKAKEFYLQCKGLAVSTVLLDNVGLYIENFEAIPYTEEENTILLRFGNVFQQSYTRFLDLQKAEAQAREAQIQLALERVRARTMAMHTSSELNATAELLFDQLSQLGAALQGVAFAICNENSIMVEKWTSIGVFSHPYTIEPGEQRMYEAWKKGEALYEEVYEGERQKKYYEAFMQIDSFREGVQKFIDGGNPLPTWQKNHAVTFKYGYLLFITTKPFKETEIFLRFGKVFEQTYTRFLDLQKAEAQAREAQIEAALEKIRSRSLAMHHSEELKDVIAIFFEKLSGLNVLLGTIAIQLFDQDTKNSYFWVANDVQQPQMVNLPFDEQMMVEDTCHKDSWEAVTKGKDIINKKYSEAQKNKYFDYVFANNDFVQVPEKARAIIRNLNEHIICLFVEKNSTVFADSWNGSFFSDEMIQVLKRAARVFEQCYIRFLDLKKAEAQALRAEEDLVKIKEARKKAEDTLVELRATQKQLIQSEKMASLGELTAGIAHEIQNPLNFVNNFSEVSTELIDEMKEELAKGNEQSAIEIAGDLKQNLEKINQHGKRADAIVKGMLEHSRTSSGKKEPTDINALCDEYLRLAYHGLRAKDKNFNVEMQTHFDKSIGKINIIAQDIGRVLLNLTNNAFYAVNEKSKTNAGFVGRYTLITKKQNNKVAITIKDNGPGIPQNIVDKIFQPFFTTKPTGQGTGLGLSLSYDIVKAHGGEINVRTLPAEDVRQPDGAAGGTEFTVLLPI